MAIRSPTISIELFNLTNLFAQTPEMFCILEGPEHVFTYVNEAHIKVLGFDATGKSVREAQPESVEVHGILDNVYKTGVTAELNEIPVTVGWGLRYFNLTYAARKDSKGVVNGILILGIEVTDQIKNREELKALNKEAHENIKKLDAVVNNLSEGMVFAAPDGSMIHWNPEALRIHDYKNLEDIKKTAEEYPDLFTLKDTEGKELPYQNWPIARTLRGEKFTELEVELIRADKMTAKFVTYSGNPIFDEEGKLVLAVLLVRDITEQKATEKALQDAIQIRDDFLSIASHELKTPITSLMMQLQISQRSLHQSAIRPLDTKRLTKSVETSITQVIRLTRMVEDLLDISRIQAGKLTLKYEKTNLSHLLSEIIERHQDVFQTTNCTVKVKDTAAQEVECDPARVDQVITNILLNSAKYGAGKPINVELKTSSDEAILSIQDHGMGIPENMQQKIFERFERAVTDNKISGWGIGLFIAKQIVVAHNGRIEVKSKVGSGSTFTVHLPLRQ